MIIIDPNLNTNAPPDITANNPFIGYANLVTSSNVSADYESPSYPATNLANPATNLLWKGESALDQHIRVDLGGSDPVDYIAVQGHNFSTAGIAVNPQGWDGTYVLGSNLAQGAFPLEAEGGSPLQAETLAKLLTDGGPSYIGDMTAGAGLTAAFDGNTNQAAAAGASKAATTSCYVGRNFVALGGMRVNQAIVYGSNDAGYVVGANPTVTLTLYGNTSAPGSATDGTSLGSTSFTDTANESGNPRTITSSDTATLWNYVWVNVTHTGSATTNVAELQIFQSAENWTDISGLVAQIPDDDLPLIIRFVSQPTLHAIRLKLAQGTAGPQAAVLYTGQGLVFQRRVYVGHTPITMGRQTSVVNGMSESGNFLGRIVLGESRTNSVALKNLSPAWYRTNMDPFIDAAQTAPFFFAWRPGGYPDETGYCWLTGDAVPVNQLPNGMLSVTLNLAGVAT